MQMIAQPNLATSDADGRIQKKRYRTRARDIDNGDPNNLLDAIMSILKLKNDLALARKMGVAAPVISKIRHGRLNISAPMLICMHEETGMPVRELRALMRNDLREKYDFVAEG